MLAMLGFPSMDARMSAVEAVLRQVEALGPEDRRKVQAFLVHLMRRDDPAWRSELAHRIDRVRTGGGVAGPTLRRKLGAKTKRR